MSFALAHFSLGASMALVVFLILDHKYEKIRPIHFFKYGYPIAVFAGLMGMFPDIGKITGTEILHNFSNPIEYIVCNIFFFHCFLDTTDPNDTPLFTAFMFGIFLTTVFISFLIYRNYRKRK